MRLRRESGLSSQQDSPKESGSKRHPDCSTNSETGGCAESCLRLVTPWFSQRMEEYAPHSSPFTQRTGPLCASSPTVLPKEQGPLFASSLLFLPKNRDHYAHQDPSPKVGILVYTTLYVSLLHPGYTYHAPRSHAVRHRLVRALREEALGSNLRIV